MKSKQTNDQLGKDTKTDLTKTQNTLNKGSKINNSNYSKNTTDVLDEDEDEITSSYSQKKKNDNNRDYKTTGAILKPQNNSDKNRGADRTKK